MSGIYEAHFQGSWVASRSEKNPVPDVLVAEAQTDETRNYMKGRAVRENREAESAVITSQGQVLT